MWIFYFLNYNTNYNVNQQRKRSIFYCEYYCKWINLKEFSLTKKTFSLSRIFFVLAINVWIPDLDMFILFIKSLRNYSEVWTLMVGSMSADLQYRYIGMAIFRKVYNTILCGYINKWTYFCKSSRYIQYLQPMSIL